jgi:hypothetical protein
MMGGAGGGMDIPMSESEVISGKDELLGFPLLFVFVLLFTITVVKLLFIAFWFAAVFEFTIE